MVVLLWTHCRGQASDREEKRNSPDTRENRDPKKTKNSTNEASMLLKTHDGISKRTQNELKFGCTMRALKTEFELFGATRVPARVRGAGMRQGSNLPELEKCRGSRENTKQWERSQEVPENKGHRFLSSANYARFARKLAQIKR